MSEIISLTGEPIDAAPSPSETLVSYLESLLDSARNGELRSALIISRFDSGALDYTWTGDSHAHNLEMLGQLHLVATHYAAAIAESLDGAELES